MSAFLMKSNNFNNNNNNNNNYNNNNIDLFYNCDNTNKIWRPYYLPSNTELLKAFIKRNKEWKGIDKNESIIKFNKLINYPPSLFPYLYDSGEHEEINSIKNGTIEPPCPDIRDFLDIHVQIRIGYKKIK